jgi:hypothetical protein
LSRAKPATARGAMRATALRIACSCACMGPVPCLRARAAGCRTCRVTLSQLARQPVALRVAVGREFTKPRDARSLAKRQGNTGLCPFCGICRVSRPGRWLGASRTLACLLLRGGTGDGHALVLNGRVDRHGTTCRTVFASYEDAMQGTRRAEKGGWWLAPAVFVLSVWRSVNAVLAGGRGTRHPMQLVGERLLDLVPALSGKFLVVFHGLISRRFVQTLAVPPPAVPPRSRGGMGGLRACF